VKGVWLLTVAALIVGQVLLGGVTRLTGSGLSITRWEPISGALPPSGQHEWEEAFARYRRIPQFAQINAHFTLADFQRIYFWEWLHRLWGRLLVLAFVVPLAVFWVRGSLAGRLPALLGLLALFGLQGFLGWYMVASGLAGRAWVSHVRLALHLCAALALLGGVLWCALAELLPRARAAVAPGAWLVLGLTALQLAYGALMAGLHAAAWAPSWPDLNGVFLPGTCFQSPRALIDDPLTVQFIHRGLAYAIAALVLAQWLRAPGSAWRVSAAAVSAQVALGVATVLSAGAGARFTALALAHQLGGVALFASLVWVAYLAPAAPAHAARAPTLAS